MLIIPASLTAAEHVRSATARHSSFRPSDTLRDMIDHPAFAGFGEHLLPRPQDARKNLRLNEISRIMPWHSHVRTDVMLEAVNRMIDDASAGRTVFYSFYKDGQRRALTGLFYFRGAPDAPFALICPGGGFAYVGSLHEGFPLAEYLSRKGYNAFVLQYRTGGEQVACEDLAAALNWIFDHARSLSVSTRNYSLWGGSAGARMVADLGSLGSAAFGSRAVPPPAAVVTAYTGHRHCTRHDPPTFAVVSEDDPIVRADVMRQRVETLKSMGISAELRVYRRAGHGFGTGRGTDAEHWMDAAVLFWERHMAFSHPE